MSPFSAIYLRLPLFNPVVKVETIKTKKELVKLKICPLPLIMNIKKYTFIIPALLIQREDVRNSNSVFRNFSTVLCS